MSRSRSKRHGWQRGDNGYSVTITPRTHDRVVAAGCGGWRDYWGDFDCSHGYRWDCGDCPIVSEATVDRPEKKLIFFPITGKIGP